MILVELSNLTFEQEHDPSRDSNVKFAPLGSKQTAAGQGRQVKIHLYTKLWNEEEMLPFFFRHYDPLVDRYIAYDDGSTDNTLELLAAHDRVEIRRFERAHPTSFELSAQVLNDQMWKESCGQADWVVLAAPDEHLYHPTGLRRYLHLSRSWGVTAIPALAFQMVADAFPSPGEYLAETRRFGTPLDHYNKLSVFDPGAVGETHFSVGRHRAAFEGHIHYPNRDRLLLLHYKFLGIDYLLRRYEQLKGRRGATDRVHNWGHQYDRGRETLEGEFAELRSTAIDVTGEHARQLKRKKWWRRSQRRGPSASAGTG